MVEPKAAYPGAKPVGNGEPAAVGIGTVACDEIIKRYFYARQKIFNFYKAWKKFDEADGRTR